MAIQYYIRGWEQGEAPILSFSLIDISITNMSCIVLQMVAVFMPNKPLFTITCLGAAKIGVPFTVGNTTFI